MNVVIFSVHVVEIVLFSVLYVCVCVCTICSYVYIIVIIGGPCI